MNNSNPDIQQPQISPPVQLQDLASNDSKNTVSLCYDHKGALLPVDTLYEFYQQARDLKKLANEFLSQLKAEVLKRGFLRCERLPELGLVVKTRQGRSIIDPVKASEILTEEFSVDEIMEFVTIGKGKLESTIKGKYPKGEKQANCDKLLNALDEAGAITHASPSQTLKAEALEKGNSK